MNISLLISILLQLGIINSTADFDEAKSEHYIDQIGNTEGLIIEDPILY